MSISDIVTFAGDLDTVIENFKKNRSMAFAHCDIDPTQLLLSVTDKKLFDYTGTILVRFPVNPFLWIMFFDSLNKKMKYPLNYAFYDITTSQGYFMLQNNIPCLAPINILNPGCNMFGNMAGVWLSFFDRPETANVFEINRETFGNMHFPIFVESPELFNPDIEESEIIVFIDSFLERPNDWRPITGRPELWEQRAGIAKTMEN